MVSAPDIITYIGVPLAVLGVLPIIYNTLATLATLQKVKRLLRHGRVTAITRGDVINHVIEVEIPRYTIAPLDRRVCKDYWRLSAFPSAIPGGAWTIFNWRMNTTGLKTQRINYSDQLRQPQAEIYFEALISYMLDLGAVPDAAGFRMLRTSGLWLPTGTSLLLSPDRHEAALTIAPLDDSDGKLSLAVRWSSGWSIRDQHSLPPYWVIIRGVLSTRPQTAPDKLDNEMLKETMNTATGGKACLEGEKRTENDITNSASGSTKTQPRPTTSKSHSTTNEPPPVIRCHIGSEGLTSAIPEDSDAQVFGHLDVAHLDTQSGNNTQGVWFASALTALGSSSEAVLWNYTIPGPILSFSRKDAIPCGVLVILGIIDEAATPEIFTKYNDEEETREAQARKMRDQSRAFQREQRLPSSERSQAVFDRHIKEHEDWVQELNENRRKEVQRAETRTVEALQSPKWDNKLVAEHNLKWLKNEDHVDQSHDLKRAVEVLLWRIINDTGLAAELGKMLDDWKAWVDNGGMRKADYMTAKETPIIFAYASLVLAVIHESIAAEHGSLAVDIQECIRIWKRVRLG